MVALFRLQVALVALFARGEQARCTCAEYEQAQQSANKVLR